MNLCRIGIVLTSIAFSASCELKANRTGTSSATDTPVVLRPIEAVLNSSQESSVNAKETRIVSKGDMVGAFERAQFVNAQNGWAGSQKTLHRTSNGGITWEKLPFKASENTRISSFFFTNESQGWMVLRKQIYTDRYGLGNSSRILTTTDGGRTWNEQKNFPDEIVINEIKFLNASRGFAIGARIVDRPVNEGPPYEEFYVLTTTNGGKVWTNISDVLKSALKTEGGTDGDAGLSIHWPSESQTFFLTRHGKIITTSDQGKTWKTMVKFRDERPQGWVSSMDYYKLISDPEQRIRVIGGGMGDEGYWGDLVVNATDNSWTSYELTRTPILDAIFLSSNDVLASGMAIRSSDDNRIPPAVGILLRSLDCGKSWTPIYRSREPETFISLTRISEIEFYAVSDAGTFVKLFLK